VHPLQAVLLAFLLTAVAFPLTPRTFISPLCTQTIRRCCCNLLQAVLLAFLVTAVAVTCITVFAINTKIIHFQS
jgi:hypothetical protein